MRYASVNGIELGYRECGSGFPLVFCHEYAGDLRSLERQIGYFSRRYRCIAFNYRGYPPSTVPDDIDAYGSDDLVADLAGLLDHLGITETHLVGVATGGGVALNFAIGRPEAVRGLAVVGPGAGSVGRPAWLAGAQALADAIRRDGMAALVDNMENAPQRQALRSKDPIAWETFIAQIREMSPVGCANMMANALMRRPPLFELESELKRLRMPVLVAVGDQDAPAFDACVFVSRTVVDGALAVLPNCGHMLPLEEPALLNTILGEFFAGVDARRSNDGNR